MNGWRVLLSPQFQAEIRGIHSYIANTLLVPDTAAKQVRRIMDGVNSLSDMPMRCPLYEKQPWRSRGLRMLTIDNFVAFFLTNENAGEVAVLHIFYGGRDIENLLGDNVED